MFNNPPWGTVWKLQSISNAYLNTTNFVAFDPSFFDIIGPSAKVEHIITADPSISHEASCYIPTTQQLYYAAWGFGHGWQYVLDTTTHVLKNITTSPPTYNAHGCVYFDESIYVATDGGDGHYGSIVKINPKSLKAETLINNFYQQPFLGFNDLDIDPAGNIWATDSISAWGRYMTTFAPLTSPAVYFINTTTMTPKWVFQTTGNANGIAYGPDGTLYVDVTDISSGQPNVKNPLKARQLLAYDTDHGQPQLRSERLFSNSISYYCDGVRVSRSGLVFCAAADGVDVIEPKSGATLGRIRTGGGRYLAVNIAFEDHVMWIVGKGGVWKGTNQDRTMGRPGLKFLERPLVKAEALTPECPIGFLANRCAKLYKYLCTYTEVLCHELIWRAILMLVFAVPSSGQQSGPRRHNLQHWLEPTDISASPPYEHKITHAGCVPFHRAAHYHDSGFGEEPSEEPLAHNFR
ncbi:hypothetical protein V496_03683 [Pseudogymnoascus sp. VKM F-4515 (FW-2607)]|nr:hypothetical protein V496_03683 [Pseudogymnoascus sp. VKM F-4515 (FW-2607)]